VGFLGAARPNYASPFDVVTVVPVEPLPDEAIASIIRARADRTPPRPQLARVTQLAGGNPFYARELARALDGRGDDSRADVTSPVPADLRDAVRGRLAQLSDGALSALVSAAALGHPTRQVLERATGEPASVEEAVRAGILELRDDSVRIAHPLFASVAYFDVSMAARRELHRRLTDLAGTDEERARHLALANEQPNAAIATALEAAAEEASRRGAPASAADLMEHAIRLTPSDETEALIERRLRAADLHYVAGDVPRGRELFEQLAAELHAGDARAKALMQLGLARSDDLTTARRLHEQALAEAADDRLRVQILQALTHTSLVTGALEEARLRAHDAVEVALRTGDAAAIAATRAEAAFCDMITGHPFSALGSDEVAELEAQAGSLLSEAPLDVWASTLTYAGEFDRARPLVERSYRRAVETGDEPGQAILLHLAFLEWRAGDIAAAERHSRALDEFARQLGVPQIEAYASFARAYVRGLRGDIAAARADMAAAEEYARAAGDQIMLVGALQFLGFVDLSEDSYEAAAERLCDAVEIMRELGWREPGIHPAYQSAAEGLIAIGRLAEAEAFIVELEALAQPVGRVCALAGAARCRGLLAAAHGETDVAVARLRESLEIQARLPEPLESARTLLALGRVLRRARRVREAREALQEALVLFEDLRAEVWAERVRAELGRLGGRAPRTLGLTTTERQIADLVAAGRTNAEVARTLHVSPKTVEWNLSKVYKKLHVSSRTELAAKLAKQAS
jgi:DNA-binding CsgD family transcriptional regulator